MKKITSLLLAVLMICTVIPFAAIPAFAETPTSGKCGENLNWSINADHTVLTFTGSGAMRDYGYYSDSVPWWDYRDTVTTINFPKEITHISNYAFCYFSKIEEFWIPSDNVSLGKQSFFGCSNLFDVVIGTADGKTSDKITIGSESFEECGGLGVIYVSRALKTVEWDAFEQCYFFRGAGCFYYGGTEQEYKDNVTVDMGDDGGNECFTTAEHFYRDEIWDTSKWCYNDTERWHELSSFGQWFNCALFDDLSRADLTPLSRYENNGTAYWQVLPDGTRINEKAINWEYDDKGYRATLPNGSVLSGTFAWQSDGYKHWYALPNGQKIKTEAHTLQDGVCTVCGGSENSTVGYIDKNGKFVISSGEPKKINSDTRTLSGGEYTVTGSVTISDTVVKATDTNHATRMVPTRLEVTEDSTIILMDGCKLNCPAGIHVQPGKTLTICSESLDPEATGSLTATASKIAMAGIGSNDNEKGAIHIVICGGRVTGKGGKYAAGIGSGSSCRGSSIVDIYNGIVEGTGGNWGAGIGGGSSAGCDVNIYYGTVTAQGGEDAADIGAGKNSSANVYISKLANATAANISDRRDDPVGATFGFPNGEPVPAVNRPFDDGDYKIYSALSDKMCVDIDGSKGATNATDNVHLWSDSTAAYNVFTLTWDANAEAYSIKVKHSGLMLDVAGGSKGNGANIQQWGDNGTDAQRWVFEHAGNGYYYIRCKGGQYMDAAGLPNGTQPFDDVNIQSWSLIGTSGQKFKLVKADANGIPSHSGSVLSNGNLWIIIAVAVVALGGVAALIIVMKKKKPALAEGAESKDEE